MYYKNCENVRFPEMSFKLYFASVSFIIKTIIVNLRLYNFVMCLKCSMFGISNLKCLDI
jgi:hypothetical protein